MKKIFLTALVMLISCECLLAQERELVWHDEFEVDGSVDSAKWNFEHGFVRNHEYQWYQEENAYVKDGILILEGRLDSIVNPRYDMESRNWKHNRAYARYTSASINTRGKFSFRYGRLEVRARIPAVVGSWPAIWTLGNDMPWPSNGEIDIMEFYRDKGGKGDPIVLANFCWSSKWGQWTGKWDSSHTKLAHFTDKDPDWANKFHVWRLDWTKDKASIYLDDELLNDVNIADAVNEGEWGRHWKGHCPFTQEHYILLNLALGGDNGGPIDDAAFPMRYEVDYVRVYQEK